MAALTETAFKSKWHFIFADNSNREVSEEDMRNFITDIADTFYNRVSGGALNTLWKDPCQVATTANIALSGEQTIDGVLTSTSRVLVKDQTTASQNGIYVSSAGAWTRAGDTDSDAEIEGAAVGVTQGVTYGDSIWLQITDSVSLGSSAIVWQQIGFGVASQNLQQVLTEGNDAMGLTIVNAGDPVNAQDVATKNYVDTAGVGTIDLEDLPNNGIEEVSATSYAFVEADHLKIKKFTNVSGCTATVPVGLDTGWSTTVYRAPGAGTLTLASAGTYEGTDNTIGTEKGWATIVHMGSNVHAASGALGTLGLGIGTIDGQTKSSNALVLTGSAIYAQTADATSPGVVSTGTQTFAGDKTFNGTIGVGTSTVSSFGSSYKNIEIKGSENTKGGCVWLSSLDSSQKGFIAMGESSLWVGSHSNHSVVFRTNNTNRFTIDSTGGVIISTAPATSNSGNSILARNSTTGALQLRSDITSGTYTPAATAVLNCSAITASSAQYMRVGNTVTVSGKVAFTSTAAGVLRFRFTLPVASNIANDYEAGGTAQGGDGTFGAMSIQGDVTNNAAHFSGNAPSGGAWTGLFYSYTYRVI